MAERYTRLFTISQTDLYETGSPLLICAGALLKDMQTGRMIAQLKFRNIGIKRIAAVKISVHSFDAFGTEVEGVPEFQYLDLSIPRDREFGQKTPIVLPNTETRSFSCTCKSVIFTDGTRWESETDEWQPLMKQKTIESRFGGLAEQYRRDTCFPSANYVVSEDRDLWLCVCGAINRREEIDCHTCNAKREELKAAENPELLKEHDEAYRCRLAEQAEAARIEMERKAEEARIEAERKAQEARVAAKKRKKIAAIVMPIIVACIAFVIVLTTFIIPNQKYQAAVELYNAGKYEEAIAAFTELNGYKDSAAQIENCEIAIKDEKYAAATELLHAGKYEEAIAAFTYMDGYKDSAAQIENCETAIKDEKYAAAEELYHAGKYAEAITAFEALSEYKDSAAQIEKCETAIKEKKYTAAAELYHAGKYEEAITALIDLNGYKDSESIKTKCMFAKAPVGSAVFFGEYEQDNDMSNGKEQIEWLVLDKDKDSVLAISKYCLFCTSELSQVQFVYEKNNVYAYLTLFMNGSFMFDYYNFNYHDDYIFETGSFTYQNGELILTSENGTVVKGEGKSSIQLHYCYQGNDRISGDFSIPSGTFKVNIVPSGTDHDFFSLFYETLFEELMTFSETAFSDEEKLFMQNSGSQLIILPSDQLSLLRNEADKRTSATAFAINQGAYVDKNKKATWYVRPVDADSPTIGYVVANTSDLNNDDYSTPSYDRICIRPAIRIYFGNSIGD